MAEKHLILCGGAEGQPNQAKVYHLQLGKGEGMVHLDTKKIVAKMIEAITPVMHDLLEIATYVYVGDQIISRGGENSFDYGNKWHREIFYKIPVCEYETWNSPDAKELLEDCLSFAGGETYHFEFVKRPERERPEFIAFPDGDVDESQYTKVALFSGGLDSFAGALEEVVGNNKKICMVSHYSNGKVLSLQQELHAYLVDIQKSKHAPEPLYMPVEVNKDKDLTREKSQRTRSFLFAALGAVIANYRKLSEVTFFENGVVGCNLSWDGQTLQARATRTTHPKLLNLLSSLISELLDRKFSFVNPYFVLTKKEVVEKLIKYHHESRIEKTRSCAGAIYHNPKTHCGTCSQCIDRRFATLAAKCLEYDPWRIYNKNIFIDPLETTHDRSMATGFTGFAGLMENMTKEGFIKKYSSEVLEIISNLNDTDRQEAAGIVFDLHKRFSEQVNWVLDDMITKHRSDLRRGLPDTCLLRMVIDNTHNKIIRRKTSDTRKSRGQKKTEDKLQIIAALLEHHKYSDDKSKAELKLEAISQAKLAKVLKWKQSRLSRVIQRCFAKNFWKRYQLACKDDLLRGFLTYLDNSPTEVDSGYSRPYQPTEKEEKEASEFN